MKKLENNIDDAFAQTRLLLQTSLPPKVAKQTESPRKTAN